MHPQQERKHRFMPSVMAPHPWQPSLSQAASSAAFGRQVVDAVPAGGAASVRWMLRRNCSISPRQLGAVYGSLCLLTLLIGGFFMTQGTPWVLLFSGLELLALGAALLVFARHVADRETLTLANGWLHVEQRFGSWEQRTELATDRLTVEPSSAQGSLLKLCSRGRTLLVGRLLRADERDAFAHELRLALRQMSAACLTGEPAARQRQMNDSN